MQSRASFLSSSVASAAATWLATTGIGLAAPSADLRDILDGVVRAILPFEHPQFPPVTSSAIADRIDSLFGLLSSPTFGGSLAYFHSTGGTLEAWASDASSDKRRFYTSVRAVTFFAFYSLNTVWPSIDYAGPILKPAVAK